MLLSTLRILADGDTTSLLLCSEVDYKTAIDIAFVLEKHVIAVFNNLPKQEKLKGIKLDFYKALPKEFDRQGYLKVAQSLNIKDRTAEKYIGILKKMSYSTTNITNTLKSKKGGGICRKHGMYYLVF